MVAYSFQRRFVDPILSGQKTQTVRAVGKRRHARPGEELQLYTGMRTKHCELITRKTCHENLPVELQLAQDYAVLGNWCRKLLRAAQLDAFARRDGFASWEEMKAFWAEHHPGIDEFEGLCISWEEPA